MNTGSESSVKMNQFYLLVEPPLSEQEALEWVSALKKQGRDYILAKGPYSQGRGKRAKGESYFVFTEVSQFN